MNETPISKPWVDPDDAPPLDPEWFAGADLHHGSKLVRRGRPRAQQTKQAVSLRLDADVVQWFKNSGTGWQTRMNQALRKVAGL